MTENSAATDPSAATGNAASSAEGPGTTGGYPRVDFGVTKDSGVDFPPDLEQRVLARWAEDDTFRASLAQREGSDEFVFYDGPPFANGLPHYGHLLTGYVKDVVPRFQTMRGKKVDRRFGWDCHGLPAELEAEKQLGIKDKSEIDTMGLAEFNAYCKQSVLRYTGGSGATTSPGRLAGSTSTTTTRPWTWTSWSPSCGPSSPCTTRA